MALGEVQIPRQWYNILSDIPELPNPLLNPQTREPLKMEKMCALFAKELVEQDETILFNLSGHGLIDLPAYEQWI